MTVSLVSFHIHRPVFRRVGYTRYRVETLSGPTGSNGSCRTPSGSLHLVEDTETPPGSPIL